MTDWATLQAQLRRDLQGYVGNAWAAVRTIGHGAHVVELYRDAARAAQRAIPAPIGPAVAGVLTKAAYELSLHRRASILGTDNTMTALALAALAAGADQPPPAAPGPAEPEGTPRDPA